MLKVQRLNNDSSWYWTFDELRLIVDPWLVGPEVDGFAWLNKQWHVDPVLPVDFIRETDAILITQSYNDHCHLATLKLLDSSIPILATSKAFKKLKRSLPERNIQLIPNEGEPLLFKGQSILAFHPGHKRDPVYFAVAIMNQKKKAIFYAPHGFPLQKKDLQRISHCDVELLMTTLTHFILPSIMGGAVNPGVEEAQRLVKQLNAKRLLNTHDEQKKMSGLVSKLAKVTYTKPGNLDGAIECEILEIEDLKEHTIVSY